MIRDSLVDADDAITSALLEAFAELSIDMVRQVHTQCRRDHLHQHASSDATVDDLHGLLHNQDAFRLLSVLGCLTANERELIVDAFYGNESYRQIADRLNLPEGTVKSRIRSALRKLRAALDQLGHAEELRPDTRALAQSRAASLTQSINARIMVEQARGIVMARDGVNAMTALGTLMQRSIDDDRLISEVAGEVVAQRRGTRNSPPVSRGAVHGPHGGST